MTMGKNLFNSRSNYAQSYVKLMGPCKVEYSRKIRSQAVVTILVLVSEMSLSRRDIVNNNKKDRSLSPDPILFQALQTQCIMKWLLSISKMHQLQFRLPSISTTPDLAIFSTLNFPHPALRNVERLSRQNYLDYSADNRTNQHLLIGEINAGLP